MLNRTAKQVIADWPLGFIATADAEGLPNVSPKGTFQVVDDRTVGFAEIRSPGTLANLAVRPEVEVNFVDVLTRRGVRLRGMARVLDKGTPGFDAHWDQFSAPWPDLAPMIGAIVLIDVHACRPLASPIYEVGADEAAMRATYLKKIEGIAAQSAATEHPESS